MIRRAALAGVLALAVLLAGCAAEPPSETPAPNPSKLPAAEETLVVVPDVIGMYPDEAATLLQEAGFLAETISVHGPVEPDAGNADIGRVYRQTPAAGSAAAPGTVIEVRSWWESQ